MTEHDEAIRDVELAVDGRLDAALADAVPDLSRSRLGRWIRQGRVAVDGAVVTRPSAPVRAGMRVTITMPPPPPPLSAADLSFDVLHVDPSLIVVNKPAGLIVHPGDLNEEGTLVHGLLHRFPELSTAFADGDARRPGIVHRLDRGTSGVMVVARTEAARRHLSEAFAARRVEKEYLAWVRGEAPESGTWNQPIGRHARDRKRFAVVAGGRAALSRFERRWTTGGVSALRVTIETGRTHQIRVHAAAAGLPLLGDPVYGARRRLPPRFADWGPERNRPALHAARLAFVHPDTGDRVAFHAPLPPDLSELDARGC